MIPPIARLYHPKGPDRVAVVSAQPSTGQAGAFVIQLARGAGPGALTKGTVYGPYAEAELEARFVDVVAGLRAEGFFPTGYHDLLLKLESPEAAKRARAALGLGWRRAKEAVEPILAAKAVDEICSFLDALGMIGDPRAIPFVREHAARKLLSRRRSGVEALRNLGDAEGLAAARQQALERLPATVREVVETAAPEAVEPALGKLTQALLALEKQHQGLALDTLYELATPLTVAATRASLDKIAFDQPHIWRYVKSIHKRAMLRHDYAMFGWLSHAIEVQGRTSMGTQATVKSGYDGVSRNVRIFGKKTQTFMRRLAWRYLRTIATHRPESYAAAAAEALIHCAPKDGAKPKGLYGQYAACYVLNRILWGGGKRFVMSKRSLRFRFATPDDVEPPAQAREEAYPQLWDAQPRAYLRVLAAAQLPEAHAFAVRAVESRFQHVLREAAAGDVLAMLQAPYEPTVKLGLAELERRFDPRQPDWLLLDQLLRDGRPMARETGERWLRLTAPAWTSSLDRIAPWLMLPQRASRDLVAELVGAGLRENASLRQALAAHFWSLVRGGQLPAENADGYVTLARQALMDELASLLSLQDVIDWIGRGPVTTLGIAAELLSRHPEAIQTLGLEPLAALAQHDVAAVRAGALRLLQAAPGSFAADPSLLLVLAESNWDDARAAAVALLRVVLRPETLGLEALTGLLDSGQVEVQNFGQEMARLRMAALPADELVYRLVQHPHPNMRRFAMELVLEHLPQGAGPLARLEQFFRTVLFDVTPQRVVKERVLEFLARRGLQDEQQASCAAAILGDVVRIEGRGDFERALEALVRIKLAFPAAAVPLKLRMEDVA